MADKYDKLLSEYYTGLLDKKLLMFEGLELSETLRAAKPDEYERLKGTKKKLDDVIHALVPLNQAIMQARYGEQLPYTELRKRFSRSETSLHKWKNKTKQRMREAGL